MHNICYLEEAENVNRAEVLEYIESTARVDGDGYSGPLKWHTEIPPMENRDAAQKKIESLDRGWYDDHAVRYYSYENAEETKKMKDIKRQIKETQEKSANYAKEHSVMMFKSEFVGCKNCGSKIAKKYLRNDHCPVCYKDLRSETTLKTLEGYKEKIEKLWQAVEDEKKKQINKREVRWLIKYEYHS